MIIAMVILFGILFIGLCVAMPASTRLGVAMFLVIPQFYFGSAPVPVSSAWIIFMGITAFVDRKVRLHQPAIIIPLFCIALFDLIYSMFSVIPGDALSACLRLIIFVILISYLFSITRQEKKSFQTAMNLLIPWIIIEAVLVWIFRLNPSIELAFLKSGFGQVFVGPAAAGLFTGAPNNVLDVVKAGGLFVNANVASMFLGISVFVCLSMAQRAKKIIFCIVALFTWTAIFATGSKTGIALAIVLPAVAFVVPYLFMRHRRRWIGPFVLFTSFLIYSGPSLIEMFFPSYADSSTISLDSRLVLWDAASVLFSQHPASGLGFGGWMEQIVQFSSDRPLPPHNLFIATWANSGLFSAIVLLIFFIVIGTIHIRRINFAESRAGKQIVSFSLCGWVWVFIHGMGDNTELYGDMRTMALLASLLALSFEVVRKQAHLLPVSEAKMI